VTGRHAELAGHPRAWARGAWGVLLLSAPRTLIGPLGGDGRARVGARVLGARQLLELVLIVRRGRPSARRLGSAVDWIHAATMLTLAVTHRRDRRTTMASAVVATLFALDGSRTGRRPT